MKLLKVLPGILVVAGGALILGTAGVDDISGLSISQILFRVLIGFALVKAASKLSEYSERV